MIHPNDVMLRQISETEESIDKVLILFQSKAMRGNCMQGGTCSILALCQVHISPSKRQQCSIIHKMSNAVDFLAMKTGYSYSEDDY